ncbi:hypothetical protein BRADI_5g16725v3 [Brachypodium distachyon]|uniref:Uncharacterized protein n=1 Tax=Brachypodium distachyon TaxID=15368 RepID=A0A2K2CHP9_BRADI|nr:hypothetical protein BRADI_5g16725v3 [Brachypodium distachyon]
MLMRCKRSSHNHGGLDLGSSSCIQISVNVYMDGSGLNLMKFWLRVGVVFSYVRTTTWANLSWRCQCDPVQSKGVWKG